jgi:RNA polymerase sigma-32 factor
MSGTKRHCDRVRKQPRLTAEDERRLICAYREGNQAAGNRLVEAGASLAIHAAYRHVPNTNDIDDMIQAATESVISALKRFDPDKGRWSTYAYEWAVRGVREHLKKKRMIRLPGDVASSVEMRAGRGTLTEESMVRLGASPQRAKDLVAVGMATFVSMSAPRGSTGLLVEDFVGAEDEPRDSMLERTVERAMKCLTPMEDHIVRSHLMDETETLSTLAEQYGICIERVRQIEVRALWKLGSVMRANGYGESVKVRPVKTRRKLKGRPPLKISEAQVAEARELLRSGLKCRDIAPRYGISSSYLETLVNGRYTRAA